MTDNTVSLLLPLFDMSNMGDLIEDGGLCIAAIRSNAETEGELQDMLAEIVWGQYGSITRELFKAYGHPKRSTLVLFEAMDGSFVCTQLGLSEDGEHKTLVAFPYPPQLGQAHPWAHYLQTLLPTLPDEDAWLGADLQQGDEVLLEEARVPAEEPSAARGDEREGRPRRTRI